MLVSVDIVKEFILFRTTKNPSFEGLSDLVDNLRGITIIDYKYILVLCYSILNLIVRHYPNHLINLLYYLIE